MPPINTNAPKNCKPGDSLTTQHTAQSNSKFNLVYGVPPSAECLEILEVLKEVTLECLDRKRRLGQYAIITRNGKAYRLEPDDPFYFEIVKQVEGGSVIPPKINGD